MALAWAMQMLKGKGKGEPAVTGDRSNPVPKRLRRMTASQAEPVEPARVKEEPRDSHDEEPWYDPEEVEQAWHEEWSTPSPRSSLTDSEAAWMAWYEGQEDAAPPPSQKLKKEQEFEPQAPKKVVATVGQGVALLRTKGSEESFSADVADAYKTPERQVREGQVSPNPSPIPPQLGLVEHFPKPLLTRFLLRLNHSLSDVSDTWLYGFQPPAFLRMAPAQ